MTIFSSLKTDMFKENPLAGWLQSCLYQSNRTLGYKYAKHNEKITAQWLGCKLVGVVYCMRNAFPLPFSPSAIPHTEENLWRQVPFRVPFLCFPELALLWTSPCGTEGPHLGRTGKVEGGNWRKWAPWSIQDWPTCWESLLVLHNFWLTQRGWVLD